MYKKNIKKNERGENNNESDVHEDEYRRSVGAPRVTHTYIYIEITYQLRFYL